MFHERATSLQVNELNKTKIDYKWTHQKYPKKDRNFSIDKDVKKRALEQQKFSAQEIDELDEEGFY